MMFRYVLFAVWVMLSAPALIGQPLLDFKRIDVRYPEISLVFKVSCAGKFRNDVGPQEFEVRENGILVKNVTLWCPPDSLCCVSASLVFDRSGSMAGSKILKVKEGGNAYVDQMNRDGLICDEAGMVSFGSEVSIDLGMTSDKNALRAAINQMQAAGRTALWDATAVGIEQLIAQAHNHCKAVIVLTDGGNNFSFNYRTVQEVTQFAVASGVKVFTIGYGLDPGSVEELDLRYLSAYTGGEYYYTATGDDISAIYSSIRKEIQQAYQECYIKYTTNCPDGTLRTVDLKLKNFCGGTVTSTRTYVAPLDRSQFQNVSIRLGNAVATGTEELLIPVILETPVHGVFSAGNFMVVYDRGYAQITGLETAGTLLWNTPVSLEDVGSGHKIHILQHTEMDSAGVLLYLRIRAGDVIYPHELQLFLYNWVFQAYCLNPYLGHGKLVISPRKPILACEVSVPETLTWNDDRKEYEPNPFEISVVVRNTGTREATDVKARISIPAQGVTLLDPEELVLSPPVIPVGGEATAKWALRVVKKDSSQILHFCVTVEAKNLESLSCCKDLDVNSARSSAIVCTVAAPDTVHFMEQYYEPEEFDIVVGGRNTGTGQTRDVYANLMQDTRFTILSPASIVLESVLPAGASAEGRFHVRMHPRLTDGYDTVRVLVQGNDTDPAWCTHPIWVQRERVPAFSLTCTTPEDSLVFSDAISEYVPNPFEVTTVATNIGETHADECHILFAGPPRFTPIGTNLRPVGTMYVGDKRTERWLLRALPRTVGGWDTLRFQVQGKGGLGRRIVISECMLPIYVPPMRAAAYELSCASTDSLRYADNRYTPDPFTFSLIITNTGTALGRNIRPAIVLPSAVRLDAGEAAVKIVPDLMPGESASVSWRLRPEMLASDGMFALCARTIDSSGVSAECCVNVFIPRVSDPELAVSCQSIDSLFIDATTGEYLGNPFPVHFRIDNTGRGAARQVRASIEVLGSAMTILDSTDRFVGDIQAGDFKTITWSVRALRRDAGAAIPIRMRARAVNVGDIDCMRSVFIPAIQSPLLSVTCSSDPEDSLFFDWSKGEFEHPVIGIALTVTNTGAVRANDVTALLMVPEGMVLAAGETALKGVVPSELEPGQSGTAHWSVQALRNARDMNREFRFLVRADNADNAECADPLFVQGSPKHCVLNFPEDVLLGFGEKSRIPIFIDRTIGKDLSSYSFRLTYDPAVISILNVMQDGTLTALGWSGVQWERIADGTIELSDYTTSSPLYAEAGALVTLYVEGVFHSTDKAVQFGSTLLHIDSASVSLNFGEIAASTMDGTVYATSDCLVPLAQKGRTGLQNQPNPFNPETRISFSLPVDGFARLTVLDRIGREMRVLIDEPVARGMHAIVFDATGLPSGIYFVRLDTPLGIELCKMILAR